MAKPAEQSKAALTADQKGKAQEWFTARAPEMTCWVCRQREWLPPSHIVRVQAADQLGGGIGYPFVLQTCAVCGHTVFFNAIVMKLEPTIDEQEQKEKEATQGKGGGPDA